MTYSRETKVTCLLIIEKSLLAGVSIGQRLRASYTHLFTVHQASDVPEGIEKIIHERFDCVLLGEGFSYAEKLDVRVALKQEHPTFDIPLIELEYQSDQLVARIFKPGAADYIIKSHPDNLQKIIKDTLRKKYREETLPQLRIQYRVAQRHLQSREKQIQKFKQAIEKEKELNRLSELELKKTLRRLSFQFDNTPLALIEWGLDYRIRRWSKEAENLFGWKAREVLGKTFRDFRFLVEEDTPDVIHWIENLREGPESKNTSQTRNYHKKGQVIYCEWCNSALYNERKEVESFISVVQDVTQLRQKEELLRESQERFHKLSQASFDGMAIHDQGLIVECNGRLSEIFGYGPEEMLHINGFRLFTTESLETILAHVKSQREKPYEVTGLRKDGSAFPAEMSEKSVLYHHRELRLITIRDITERKQAENALRESEVRFRSTFEQAAVGLLHIDLEGQFIRANQKMATISGYAREELLAMSIYQLLDPQQIEADQPIFSQVIKGQLESHTSEKLLTLKNGESRWVNLNISRVVDDHAQRAVYFVAVIEDISERKKAELALQEVNADLDIFVYNASHDLRGPIASLLGLCTVAEMEVVEPEARNYLSLIQKTAHHMNGVLLSLILMSRVKHHQPERTRIDFQQLFDQAVHSLREENNFARVQFRLDVPPALAFHSDASLITTILTNIFENAVRYQHTFYRQQPVVEMTVRALRRRSGVEIRLGDNGMGIPTAVADKIFEMFFRATEQSTGPGLGLYVVKKITEKLGGSITLDTTRTERTEFVIQLPEMEA